MRRLFITLAFFSADYMFPDNRVPRRSFISMTVTVTVSCAR